MKMAELRTKDRAALQVELSALLKAQVGLRMQRATQQLNNTAQIQKTRRAIARIRTLFTEKAGQA
jgi:large subunit ribosomal protein L29